MDGQLIGFRTTRRSRKGHIYRDALALLTHICEVPFNPYDKSTWHTYKSLSAATRIPVTSVRRLIRWHLANGKENCVLHYVAARNGIIFKYVGRRRHIVYARRGDAGELAVLIDPTNTAHMDTSVGCLPEKKPLYDIGEDNG